MSLKPRASLDSIARANGRLGTDELRKLGKYNRPTPTWHLDSKKYKALVVMLKRAGMLGDQS